MLTGTSHFSLAEVQAHTEWPIPARFQDDAQATLETLEEVRAVLGCPLRLTSLWRSAGANAQLPGSVSNSAHLMARAADVVPVGISMQEAAARWAAAVANGTAPELHQFLVEEAGTDGLGAHIHIATGTGQQTIARTASGAYVTLREWLGKAGDAVSAAASSAASAASSSPRSSLVVVALLGGALALSIFLRTRSA